MSHHFDYPQDETEDITDAFCFAGAAGLLGPRTVFGVNTSPLHGAPWNPAAMYELKVDTDGDLVEDITWRATFPIGPDGTQHVRVEQLTGAAATDRTATGRIITPPDCPVGEVVECHHGIGVSERTLQRAVLRAVGTSPIRFVQDLRVERATHLLRTTDLSMEVISRKVGYEQANTLRVLLRERTGKSTVSLRTVQQS